MRKGLKKILAKSLPQSELVSICSSHDIIGDIAIIRQTDVAKKHMMTIAEAIMNIHRNVKTILIQTSLVHSDFRLRKLEFIAGKGNTATLHRESGCLFHVDLNESYFSPRLFHERMRIARQIRNGEIVLNMFAGVGCFSIIIAKHSNSGKVHSIDVNSAAFRSMRENVRVNRVYGKVMPFLGDAKELIEKRFNHVADRVLMPLPERALEYLPSALFALKKAGGWVHYYDFEHAIKSENPVDKVKLKVAERLENMNVYFKVPFGRVVRTTGPNWHQVVLDIRIENVL